MKPYDEIKNEMKKKVNAVFIAKDEDAMPRAFCYICRQYMVYSEKRSCFICTNCGDEATPNKEGGDRVVNDFKSEPMIGVAKKGKHSRSDFPEGSYIKEDREISSTDGEETQLIEDNRDT
jgi:hypothetical protein